MALYVVFCALVLVHMSCAHTLNKNTTKPHQLLNVICPDGGSCPDGDTCCDSGCCPSANAVCCSDGIHCCPSGTTCDLTIGKCIGDVAIRMLLAKPRAKQLQDVICPDGGSCPDGDTCCDSGCCPSANAVCCSDGIHCCPSGTTCDLTIGKCIGDVAIRMLLAKPRAKQLQNVICPDGGSCPDGDTCCDSGCCPSANAVCCSDGIHCCPSGTTCDLTIGKCIGDVAIRMLLAKPRAKQLQNVICPDGGSCPDGDTCCDSGCCPSANAVCCSDGIHCCPSGTTCDLADGKCIGDVAIRVLLAKPRTKQLPNVICPDGGSCPAGNTCCSDSGTYVCCPTGFGVCCGTKYCCGDAYAVCCNGGKFCCPSGYSCDNGSQRCLSGAMSFKANPFLKRI